MKSAISLGAALLGLASGFELQARQSEADFNWTSITPSSDLKYHECYGGFKCARLKVPLDWKKAEEHGCNKNTKYAAIAIVTLPAAVKEDDPSFGGTILINPGGPGESGTNMALGKGAYIQNITDDKKHFEILGFDPRGIALSTPSADCYGSDYARGADMYQKGGLPTLKSNSTLGLHYAAAEGLSGLCADMGPDSIFAHMSTAVVARDMVEIVDRVEALRRKTYPKSPALAKKGELPRLQYLGVSYGTFLGNTFASMYPGRVGRMIIDGVVDAVDYATSTLHQLLPDTEKVIQKFYDTCYDAKSDCALYAKGDDSANDIRQRVDGLLASLDESPAVVAQDGRIHLVTAHQVQDIIRAMLYSPITYYEPVSVFLAEAIAGNVTNLINTDAEPVPTDVCTADSASKYPVSTMAMNNEALIGIFCSDSWNGPDARNISSERASLEVLEKQSPTVSDSYGRLYLSCAGWTVKPKWNFQGPFGSPKPKKGSKKTASAPLLILSNRYDHITPLANAYTTSKEHPGSTVVVQESYGHCALLTSKSECTTKIVRKYLQDGVVPDKGTICQPDCEAGIPFKACPGFAE